MALRVALMKYSSPSSPLGARRWAHSLAQPLLFDTLLSPLPETSRVFILPESDRTPERNDIGMPSFGAGASMELMAVPNKKVLLSITLDGCDHFKVLLWFWGMMTTFYLTIFSIGFQFLDVA